MKTEEEQTLINVLNNLGEKIDKNKSSKLVDIGMRVAATISTAGILAVFALFFTTIPSLKQSISDIAIRQQYIKEDLQALGAEPRFSLKDYNLNERDKDAQRARNTAILDQRQGWITLKDKKDNDQDYKIESNTKAVMRIFKKLEMEE